MYNLVLHVWAGTKLKYKPGIVMGGKNLVHDCGVSRSIGYFLEPLLVLGLFGKKPLTIKLKGKSVHSSPFSHATCIFTLSYSFSTVICSICNVHGGLFIYLF